MQVRNFLADIYAARLGERIIMFDAGMDPEGHALELLAEALGSDRVSVSDLFLTHAHFDHVAGAGLFRKARIYIGANDAEVLADRASARSLMPWLFGMLLGVSGVEASHRLSEAIEIDVGDGHTVLALPFPGHTKGSFVYLFDAVLFTGDALLVSDGTLAVANPDRGVDPALDCKSLAQLAELVSAGRISRICTGHMGCTPEHHAGAMLEELTASAAKLCPR
jgi:glyoxylase-like metal-dependent hydrolase (beta-lactamase superfamily II)